jgi:hypothetical protein
MTETIWESVIESLSNEKDYYKKQVSKLEKVIEAQKQEAIIVQCGLDFLEAQELEKQIKLDIEIENAKIYSKELDTKIAQAFKRLRNANPEEREELYSSIEKRPQLGGKLN